MLVYTKGYTGDCFSGQNTKKRFAYPFALLSSTSYVSMEGACPFYSSLFWGLNLAIEGVRNVFVIDCQHDIDQTHLI